jgi:uncharacterized protein (DUF58 family)
VIKRIKNKSQGYWAGWIKKRRHGGNPQTLHDKNIYIFPSAFGWGYALLLLTLLSGAINYQISSIFLMVFLLGVIGLASAWEAHVNLKDLSIKFIAIEDVPQGRPAQLILLIQAHSKKRFGLEFQVEKQAPVRLEEVPCEGVPFIVPITTATRGRFLLPRIVISSFFPFGIFRVWGYAVFDEHYHVFPEPLSLDLWPTPVSKRAKQTRYCAGDEELYDLKQVENPWTQPKLIAWKIAAKGQGWYLKTMNNNEGDYWLFRLNDLPLGDLETRLCHLSYWLHTAESKGYLYSLELGTSQTPFSQGEPHLKHCLRQLALYP